MAQLPNGWKTADSCESGACAEVKTYDEYGKLIRVTAEREKVIHVDQSIWADFTKAARAGAFDNVDKII